MQCDRRTKVLRLYRKLQQTQMPFQESPSRQQGYRGNGGRRTTNKFVCRKKGRQTQSQGKGQHDNKRFSQQFLKTYTHS